MNAQLFLNNFDSQFIASVKGTPVTGTPATELDYGIVRVSQAAGAILGTLTSGDYYILTAFKRSSSNESSVEIMKVTSVDTSVINETRLTVLRGQEGTTPQDYVSGDYVSMRETASMLGNMLQKSGNLSGLADNAAARTNLGLGNVNNTSDANKPISTAQQTALDAKAEKTAIYITATDATASLNAAIAALPSGGTIFITKGVHDISSEITVSGSGIRIIGDAGAVLRRLGAFPIFKVTGSNNTIENLKLDGNRAAYPYPANARAAIVVVQGDSNTVTGCAIENGNSHGILFPATGAPDSNVVDRNSIRNCDEVGIAHDSGTDNRILNNRVTGCGYEAITLDQGAYRCIVGDNRLNANCQTGGVGSIGVDGTDLCVIANNVITGTLSGLSGITFQNNFGSSNLNAITGNVLDSNGGYGINLKTGTGGSCSNNTITGNILRSNNTLGSIKIGSGCQGNVLRGNHYGALPDIDPLSYNQVEPGLVFFYVKNTVARTNVTGDNTSYQIPFDTITQNRNLGSSFNTTTGVFTSPITGLYQLSAGVRTSGGGLHDFLVLQIVTTGGIFANGVDYTDKGAQECAVSGTIFMRKGETAYVSVRVGGDTKTVAITSEGNHNYLTGILVG